MTTLAITLPTRGGPGWAKESRCWVRAGWYQSDSGREVYVREQAGDVTGWRYKEWAGTTPTRIVRYVRVSE